MLLAVESFFEVILDLFNTNVAVKHLLRKGAAKLLKSLVRR
jgi:hypothetical protein